MTEEGAVREPTEQTLRFGVRQRLRVPPSLLPPEVLSQGSVSSSEPTRRHYRHAPLGITTLIEICQLRESLSLWSGSLGTRLAILDHFSDHFRPLWATNSGRRTWFYLTEVVVDPAKQRQKGEVRAGFLRKSCGLLGFHLCLTVLFMLLTSWYTGGWSLHRYRSGHLVGFFVAVFPELFRLLLEELEKADALPRPVVALTFQSLIFGVSVGLLDPSLVDSFSTHSLLILTQMAVAASFLAADRVLPITLSIGTCALSAVLGDWFGVLGAWCLRYPVDWGGAAFAGLFSVLLAIAYIRHYKDKLSRGNPDDYLFVVLKGSQCAIIPSILRQCYRVCGAALQFKVMYYLTLVVMGTISLIVVVLSSDAAKGGQECLSSTETSSLVDDNDQEDLTVRVQLPLGISIATTRFGLPRVEYIPPNSSALGLGIQVGDVLVGVNGLPVTFSTWKHALEMRGGVSELRFRRSHSFAPAIRRGVTEATRRASDLVAAAASTAQRRPDALPRLARSGDHPSPTSALVGEPGADADHSTNLGGRAAGTEMATEAPAAELGTAGGGGAAAAAAAEMARATAAAASAQVER